MVAVGELPARQVRLGLGILAAWTVVIIGLALAVGLEPLRLIPDRLILPAILLFLAGVAIGVGRFVFDAWRGKKTLPPSTLSVLATNWLLFRLSLPLSFILLVSAAIVTGLADFPFRERLGDAILLAAVFWALILSLTQFVWLATAVAHRWHRNRI